jgi:ubiquinone/menaquinone biosynthesis C-methylase UbiE
MIDMELAIDKFKKDGYLVVEPGVIFSEYEIQKILDIFDTLLPDWNEGFIDSQNNDSHKDPRFGLSTKFNDDIILFGCALRQRLYNGRGSANSSLDNNFLFGKRSTIREIQYPLKLLKTIENKNLLNFISSLLGCSSLSFHNGSIASVYPGCTGEDKKFHMDTSGFLGTSKNLISDDRFIVNAFVLLNDVDEDLAPVRFIPGSHARYKYINEHLAKILGKSASQNNIPQASYLWEELLPDDLHPPIKFTGKKGSICFLNSTLLHSATENKTEDKVRKVMIFNYSNRMHTEFSKYYLNNSQGCRKLYNKVKDKDLVERTFQRNSRFFLKRRFKHVLAKSYNVLRERPRVFLLQNIGKLLNLWRNAHPIRFKMYLNLGAGSTWRHSEVVSLDFDPDISEVSLDLNHHTKLPFEDSRFFGVYSSHCFEHLKESQVKLWVSEVFRTLKIGGTFRVTLPDITKLFDAYEAKDVSFFNWIKRGFGVGYFDSWLRILIRQFAAPVVDEYNDEEIYRLYQTKTREEFIDFFNSQVEVIKDKRLLTPDTHKSWWTEEKMIALMKDTGFSRAEVCEQNNSNCNMFQGRRFNKTHPHMSLFVEATK